MNKTTLFGIAAGVVLLFAFSARAAPVFDDDFSSSTLKPEWTILADDPTHWSLTANPGKLRITSQLGEPWPGDYLKNIFGISQPDEPWTMETELSFSPTTDYQQAGLFVYAAPNYFIKVLRVSAGGVGKVEFSIAEPAGTNYSVNSTATDVYLQLSKMGDVFTARWSTDGISFADIGTHSTSAFGSAGIGLYAANGNRTAADIPADFNYFTVVPEPALLALLALGAGVLGNRRPLPPR